MPLRIPEFPVSHLCLYMDNPVCRCFQSSEWYIGIGHDRFLSHLSNPLFINHPTMYLTYLLHGAESFLRSELVLQQVKKFPALYGTRRFVTVFTSVHHLSLSWANSIQSPPPPTSRRSNLIFSSHLRLGLPNGLFPSGFPTRTLCTTLSSPIRATCLAHLILLDFMWYIYIFIYIYICYISIF